MTSQERDLLIVIPLAILVFIFVHHFNKGKKKYDPKNYLQGPGQLFDTNTYVGNIRFLMFSCLVIYGGRHIDEMAQWLWQKFGEELIVSPEKAAWHARVALVMGMLMLVSGILNIQRIYKDRKRKKELRHKTDEEVALRLKDREEQKSIPGAGHE